MSYTRPRLVKLVPVGRERPIANQVRIADISCIVVINASPRSLLILLLPLSPGILPSKRPRHP